MGSAAKAAAFKLIPAFLFANLSLRLQFLRRSPGIYGALGFRVDIGFNAFPVDRFTDRVRIQSFRRQDFSVPLVLGYSRRRVHVWAGPKLMFSRYRGAVAVCTRRVDDDCRGEATLNASGRATFAPSAHA